MKKILFGIFAVVLSSGISYAADVQQQDASVGLTVPQIIELVGIDMSETVTPGPEDYARDLMVARVVNDNGSGQRLIYARSVIYSSTGVTYDERLYVVAGFTSQVPSTIHRDSMETQWRNGVWNSLPPGMKGSATFPNGTTPNSQGSMSGPVTSEGLAWILANWYPAWIPSYDDQWDNLGSNNTGNKAAVDNAMYDANNDIGKGFAERTAAMEMTIFTNAQDGAALFVHGLQPATQQNILRLEDTYVSVCTEKTYILQNDLEGAYANACSGDVMEQTSKTASDVARVEDNPRNNMGGDGTLTATMGIDSGVHTGDAVNKAYSTWLRIHNQSQHLFEVKMSTKAPRLVVVNLGIANLARYTEGEYTNTLTFTLMPIVG